MSRLNYAQAQSLAKARCVLFGANTSYAGRSQSYVGQTLKARLKETHLFSADALRLSDNESPSLPANGATGDALFDEGNIELSGLDGLAQIEKLEKIYAQHFRSGKIPLGLGGDHLIKAAALFALAKTSPKTGVIYLDAHPDCLQIDDIKFDSILHHAFKKGIEPKRTVIVAASGAVGVSRRGSRNRNPSPLT